MICADPGVFLENSWWRGWFSDSWPLWHCQQDKRYLDRLQLELCIHFFGFCQIVMYFLFCFSFHLLEYLNSSSDSYRLLATPAKILAQRGRNFASKSHHYFKRNTSIRKIRLFIPILCTLIESLGRE